jgi:hypothetical protein
MVESAADPATRLREEMGALAVDDILSLCYALTAKPDSQQPRLRLYLDVLRRRGGERAQFASCLICFDLARQGDTACQREFVFLTDTVRGLARREDLVTTLIGGDPYLVYLWELCQAQLSEADPRFADSQSAPETLPDVEIAQLDLLSDEDMKADLADFKIEVDDETLWLRFDQAVEDFLGGEIGLPVYDANAGFRVKNSRDVERIEKFLRELESLREFIAPARGYRALVLIFYATHIRSKSLFGQINERKQALLRAGIMEFVHHGKDVWDIAGVLGPMHADNEIWEKVVDVLQDYVAWCAEEPHAAESGPEAYDAVGRLITRDGGRGNWRRSAGI